MKFDFVSQSYENITTVERLAVGLNKKKYFFLKKQISSAPSTSPTHHPTTTTDMNNFCKKIFDSKLLPTCDSLYAEIPLAYKLGHPNMVKYSASYMFHGINVILDDEDAAIAKAEAEESEQSPSSSSNTKQFYSQSIQCVFEQDIKVCIVVDSYAGVVAAAADTMQQNQVLPAKSVLRINKYLRNCNHTNEQQQQQQPATATAVKDNDAAEKVVVLAKLKLIESKFNYKNVPYELSVGMETKLTDDNDDDVMNHLKNLHDANEWLHAYTWYIRCFFNDDEDFIFRVSFQRHLNPTTTLAGGEHNCQHHQVNHLIGGTINSLSDFNSPTINNNNYTLNITCADLSIASNQFVIVSDLLYKYYNAQRSVQCEKIKPTFMDVKAISNLTVEQKMLLATMELVDINTINDVVTPLDKNTSEFIRHTSIVSNTQKQQNRLIN